MQLYNKTAIVGGSLLILMYTWKEETIAGLINREVILHNILWSKLYHNLP